MPRLTYLATAFFVLKGLQVFSVIDRILYGEWAGKLGDKFTQGLNLLLIVSSLVLLSRGFPRLRSIRTSASFAIGLAVVFLFSSVWSIDPQITVREAILYLFVVVGAIGIATDLKVDEYMDLLALMAFLAGLASLVLLVVFPADALGGEGDFRGVFSQKNTLGRAMAMGALASLHGLRAEKRRRLRRVVFLVLVTMVALKSGSATSCLTIFAFCVSDAVIALVGRGGIARILGVGLIVAALPIGVSTAIFPDSILEIIGKDPTLTGRTEIWALVIPDIYQKLWFGWGYLAFWSSTNPAAIEIGDLLHLQLPQAHNGLLEMLLGVGLVGTVFVIFLWARTVRLALRCMRTAETALAISCLFSCAGIILSGLSEAVLVDAFEAPTSVFFITCFFCERAVRAARLRRYPAARYDVSRGIPPAALGRTNASDSNANACIPRWTAAKRPSG
jgi:exopolysaccharide production protein ExoQ